MTVQMGSFSRVNQDLLVIGVAKLSVGLLGNEEKINLLERVAPTVNLILLRR
ncbi:hypothetical protein KIN20_026728 [Parelaphostrongylus tenuis]|uniref:Uncharacterized protein n=1 Tax=Parelaphostrongylus tenuis TaxID=148309 RepID=A0AAD5QYF9_PARTN|nr:hypothetical protein KIN20_026728 [Parelaphostrongylus tenuis]